MATMSNDAIEIVPYSEAVADAHVRFAERMWPMKRRRREDLYNRWKFRGPKSGSVDGLLVAVSAGDVLGQLGLIPADLDVGGTRMRCQWACDLMVDTSRRRRGIGSLLFEAAMTRGIVTLGSNPSAAADATMQRIGFRPVTGPAIAVFPLDPTHALSWKLPAKLAALGTPLATLISPALRWRGRRMLGDAAPSEREVTHGTWNDVAPLVQARQRRSPRPHIVHDDRFLAWRCDGLPGFVEALSTIRGGGVGYAIVGAGSPYYYVYDWGADSWDEFISVFAAVARAAIDARAMTIQVYAAADEDREWLRRAGFLFLRQRCQILCHPPERLLPAHSEMDYSIFDSDGNL